MQNFEISFRVCHPNLTSLKVLLVKSLLVCRGKNISELSNLQNVFVLKVNIPLLMYILKEIVDCHFLGINIKFIDI